MMFYSAISRLASSMLWVTMTVHSCSVSMCTALAPGPHGPWPRQSLPYVLLMYTYSSPSVRRSEAYLIKL